MNRRQLWDVDKISILTDTMVASVHCHAMMQFFVCTEGKLNIKVGKEQPDGENKGPFAYCAISVPDLQGLSLEWKGTDIFVQNGSVVKDYGRKKMNRTVNKILSRVMN